MRDAQGATGSSPYLVYVIGGGDRPRVIDYLSRDMGNCPEAVMQTARSRS